MLVKYTETEIHKMEISENKFYTQIKENANNSKKDILTEESYRFNCIFYLFRTNKVI